MSAESWHRIGRQSDFAAGSLRGMRIEGHRLCVGRSETGWFAVADTCPHAGGSLSEGMIEGREIICPLHAWGFDVATGTTPDDTSCKLAVYQLRTCDEDIEVRIEPGPRRRQHP